MHKPAQLAHATSSHFGTRQWMRPCQSGWASELILGIRRAVCSCLSHTVLMAELMPETSRMPAGLLDRC